MDRKLIPHPILVPSSFEEVKPLWENALWPGRKSPLKELSPIGRNLAYQPEILASRPSFWALKLEDEIVGTVSGYRTDAEGYRSRGLYVAPRFRGKGMAQQLLAAVCAQARRENCRLVWSLPRQTAWISYKRFGFQQSSDWFTDGMEFGPNCLAVYAIAPNPLN